MPRSTALAALALIAGPALLVGCSGRNEMTDLPKPSARFCDAGRDYEAAITRKRPAAVAEQLGLVRRMEAAAPDDIAADTTTFRAALERVRGGDRSAVDAPEVRDAVTRVNRRYSQGCGVYDRRGGI